jgi:hypothetical protein
MEHCTDSSCGLYRISEPRTSDHGRGEAVANSSCGPPLPWRPRRVSRPPELHRDLCRQPDGRLLSRCRAAQRRNRYVYNCLAELKMNIFRLLLSRKRSALKGGGQQDDRLELAVARTSRSRRQQVHPPPDSAIFTFLRKKVYILWTI